MFELQKMSNAVRVLSADMIEKAKSGHPGMPLGMADVATVCGVNFYILTLKIHNGLIGTDLFYLMVMVRHCYIV